MQAAADQPAALPPLPDWAQQLDRPGESRRESLDFNRQAVMDANQERRRLDFVLWGDSITAALQFKFPQTWDKWFGEYDALPLGVSASTVEELTWRIMGGRERFALGPKVSGVAAVAGMPVALHITVRWSPACSYVPPVLQCCCFHWQPPALPALPTTPAPAR